MEIVKIFSLRSKNELVTCPVWNGMLNCVIVENQFSYRSIVFTFIPRVYFKVVCKYARHRTAMTSLRIRNITGCMLKL